MLYAMTNDRDSVVRLKWLVACLSPASVLAKVCFFTALEHAVLVSNRPLTDRSQFTHTLTYQCVCFSEIGP